MQHDHEVVQRGREDGGQDDLLLPDVRGADAGGKDFVGKRSFDRADTARTDRKHLVGLLPIDRSTTLPEATQLVAEGVAITPEAGPVPMLGHVTSSYHSEALGRPFALGLVAAGRDRIGQTIVAPVGDMLVPVLVADPVLYDPEGARRDG